jgi:glutaredoxin
MSDRRLVRLALSVTLLGCTLFALAGLPSWAAPPRPGDDRVEVVRGTDKELVRPGEDRPRARPAKPAKARDQAGEFPRVELFMAEWCGYCRRTEAFLKQNGVPYERKNIEQDARFQREYEALDSNVIPVVRIDGRRVLRGYRPEVLARELGLEPAK